MSSNVHFLLNGLSKLASSKLFLGVVFLMLGCLSRLYHDGQHILPHAAALQWVQTCRQVSPPLGNEFEWLFCMMSQGQMQSNNHIADFH